MVEALKTRVYSSVEEVFHTLTHGLGAILSVLALIFVVLKASVISTVAVAAVSIYAGCMILLYVCSTLYHGAYKSSFQPFFETLDHAAIYLMIAGTYTPFALLTLEGTKGMAILVGIWILASIGVALKFVAHFIREGHEKYDRLSLLGYIGMGWVALLVIGDLWVGLPTMGFVWLVAGGLIFTIGAGFYAWKNLPFSHTTWHVFVMGGSACHFVSIYSFVLS